MDKKTLDRLLGLGHPMSDSDLSESEKQFVDELHRSILGSPVRDCSCRHRYVDAYIEIMATLPSETRKLARMANQRKYRLIPGYLIYHEGSHYSNANLTDEVAAAYLKKHPDAVKQFDLIPDPEPEPVPEPEPELQPEPEPEQEQPKKGKK